MEAIKGLGNLLPKFSIPEVIAENDEKRVCPKHGEYIAHVIKYNDDSSDEGECPFCTEERQKLMKEKADKKAREEHEVWCREHNIEPEFYHKTLDDYIPQTEGQKRAKEEIERMINQQKGKVVILGSNGVGKSMLINIAAKELKGKVFTMYEISTMIRQSYTNNSAKSELDIVNELASLPFLGIDEIGRVAMSEAVMNWFSYILDKRSVRNLPFTLTGNVHLKKDCPDKGCPKCFENLFDTDILSRLRKDTAMIIIKAPDFRKKVNDNSYFSYWEDK